MSDSFPLLHLIFGSDCLEMLKSEHTRNIKNIDRDLIELLVAGIYALKKQNLVWIVGENENLREKEAKLRLWLKLLKITDPGISFYKLPFADPYINNQEDMDSIWCKIRLIQNLQEKKRILLITTLSALSIKIEDRSLWKNFTLNINCGERINRNQCISNLIDLGYQSTDFVEEKGDISWRGSIVDVFPINSDNPVRIEWQGNVILSIRFFDGQTQKSIKTINSILVSASRFFLQYKSCKSYLNSSQKNLKYLMDLLTDFRVVTSDLRKIEDGYDKLLKNYTEIFRISAKKEGNSKKVSAIFEYQLDKESVLSINEVYDDISAEAEVVKFNKSIVQLNLDDIKTIGNKIKKKQYRCFVCSQNPSIGDNLKSYWGNFDCINQNIPFSFENKKTNVLFLAFKHFEYQKRSDRFVRKSLKSDYLQNKIKAHDFVVHKKHGIGRFMGLNQLEFNGISSEFLKIEYQDSEFLYVPVYELDVLSKFVAFEGYEPKVDKLGGRSWRLKHTRAKKSIINFAKDLLELYALRKAIKGNSFPKDYEMEDKLQMGFQFLETDDQKRAFQDVFEDLEAEFPMDRLICGDVSFGKTEVAVRAAFRIVCSGKQVAFLCPTTILAFQHFNTFKTRFEQFPLKVALLSRMVPKRESAQVYDGLKKGSIDIVIGTHSLLSKEIKFKDLGLFIIDEEQRFGVFQKEKLKKSREDVDCLSLSATPIPRTLSLSMSGLQDLSIIQTPPVGRLSIRNYVGYFSRAIMMSAILNELERDGLIYIVYNNIEKIYSFKDELQSWLPDVKMTVIHAKLKTTEIEKNLFDFIHKKYRILVSTTIIENGIDIPAVNTLIVLDADKLGLTQLYQLRGRIGRSNRQAYAFFLVQSMNISEKARSRLDAIREFAELGSGFKLAELDLTLRGAGSLLGNKQHGHIEAMGYDYYLSLLNKTVKELKGETDKKWECKIKINFSYSINSSYIKNSSERIGYYKKILEAGKSDEIDDLKKELHDRYGKMDESMNKIFFVALIKIIANQYFFKEIGVYSDKVRITFSDTNLQNSKLVRNFSNHLQVKQTGRDLFEFYFNDMMKFIQQLSKLCL